MGTKCCTEGGRKFDLNTEILINRGSKKKKLTTHHPFEKGARIRSASKDDFIENSEEEDEQGVTLVDFQVYGRSDPTEINRQTRVVKQGKKVRVYNYREIPLEDEDLKFSLNKAVAETYKAIGPYNYTRIVREGLFDKRIYRYMKAGNIMVDGSKYTGQFLRDTSIKDGIGQIIYTDGSLFEGVFKKNDTLKGRYITTNGYVYEGSMKNHKMHGYGILKYKEETIHEGEFEDGEQVGDKFEVMSSLNSTITATDSAIGKVVSKKSVQFDLK